MLRALLDAAAGWLRERGRDRMVGPMDFTMNDESGVLIEGFEREPMVRQPWQPPYYQRLCEEAGLEKAVDLFMWELTSTGRDKVLPIIWELADKLEPKHGIRIRKMTRRTCAASSTRSPRSTTRPGRATGASCPTPRPISTPTPRSSSSSSTATGSWWPRTRRAGRWASRSRVPDINQVLKRMNGRLLPFGWWHYLRRRRIVDRVPRRVPGGQARLSAHRRGRRALRGALRHGRGHPRQGGRNGLDPRDQQGDEPRAWRRWAGGSSRSTGFTSAPSDAARPCPGYTRGVPDYAALPDPEHEAEVRPLPVLAEPRTIERARECRCPPPWRRPPAASSSEWPPSCWSGCCAARARRPLRLGRGRGKKAEIAASRSFLVDIHLLKDR